MMIDDCVQRYVEWKRANGYRFERSRCTLRAFSKALPQVEMTRVTGEHILGFLNRQQASTITWRLRYWTLFRFFEYWSYRGVEVQFTMPPPKPVVRQTFTPHVFTTSELRSLLTAVSKSANSHRRMDEQTLRTVILFLYATGASVGEVASIQRSDVDIDGGFVSIRSTRPNRARRIPIGDDLRGILHRFMELRQNAHPENPYLFVTKTGLQISTHRFGRHFRRLRNLAGIRRGDGSRYQPRVDDLRYSFAIHRIAKWIEEGADLNRMLPALAAYMGQMGLGSTERYLFMTPERFRRDLDKLSPRQGKGRWCENYELIAFLSSL